MRQARPTAPTQARLAELTKRVPARDAALVSGEGGHLDVGASRTRSISTLVEALTDDHDASGRAPAGRSSTRRKRLARPPAACQRDSSRSAVVDTMMTEVTTPSSSPRGAVAARAAVYRALGDKSRLSIVDALLLSDRSPKELRGLLGLPTNLLAFPPQRPGGVGLDRP